MFRDFWRWKNAKNVEEGLITLAMDLSYEKASTKAAYGEKYVNK